MRPTLIVLVLAACAADAPSAPVSSFAKRVGSQITVDGKPFRFGGLNAYWLGLDENEGGVHCEQCAIVAGILSLARVWAIGAADRARAPAHSVCCARGRLA